MNNQGSFVKYIFLGFSIGCACFLILILFLTSGSTKNEVKQTRYGNFENEPTGEVAGAKDRVVSDNNVQFAMELAKNGEAEDYCKEREDNERSFPVILNIDTGKISHKKGSDLTLEDCRKNIDFLYKIQNQLVMGIVDINEGKFTLGMGVVEFQYSVGFPDDINETVVRNYKQSQYVYNKGSAFKNMYFYFENGELTSYQDF